MQIQQLLDACLAAAGFALAFALRSDPNIIEIFNLHPITKFKNLAWLFLLIIPMTPLVLEVQGFYNRPIFASRRLTAWLLSKSCALMVFGVIAVTFLVKAQSDVARSLPLWFGILTFLLIWAKEELFQSFFRSTLAQEQHRRRFIVAGTPEETARIRQELKNKAYGTIEVVAELDLNASPVQRLVLQLHEHSVNGVIISARGAGFDQVEAAIRACEVEGVESWLVADFFRTQISRTSFDEFHGLPVLVFSSTPEASWQCVLKQVLDFFGALALLIVLAPVLAVVCVLVKLSSKGPIFFTQQRSGLNGRPFTLYKFRTMVTNAEQLKHELAAMNEMSGPVFKITNDPRITPLGRALRKFSIDEFPQLVNVLRGEMSLVGPRPLPVDEVKRFNDLSHRRRLSVKPGLTCLWQISGRNEVKDFRDWVRLDLEYIDNWSLWLDLKILLRTIPVVIVGHGAR